MCVCAHMYVGVYIYIYTHMHTCMGAHTHGCIHVCAYNQNIVSQIFTFSLFEPTRKKEKERSRRYLAQTITDMDYADDISLLANTPAQAETQLYSMERAAAGIGLHLNAHKTEYTCFNQRGDISTQNGSSLKLVDKFT